MDNTRELLTILPEMLVTAMACVVLLVDIFQSDKRRNWTYLLSLLTLVFAALITLGPVGSPESGGAQLVFAGTFVRDTLSDLLKLFVYLITGTVFIYSKPYLEQRGLFKGEFYMLGLFGMLGMMVMISAHNLITLYLGLELLALSAYAMVAMDRDNLRATEAAMKYFVLGALASGMLLYGMSMIYGATGSLDLAQISEAIGHLGSADPILAFGLAFILVGLAFKFGAAPFHMWVPDVYHGAPTAVTVYISSAPKLAAFAMAFRLLHDALGGLKPEWQSMLAVLAVLSMGVGNIVAIAQSNLKRMLGYSTVSHVGFIFLGLVAGTVDGFSSAMFYTITYATMTAGAFGMMIYLSQEGFEAEEIEDYKGLAQRSPWFASIMAMLMFSLAGVPIFVGFFAKLLVLKAVFAAGFLWLAITAVVFSVIGAYYYLRVVKVMFFDEPVHDTPILSEFDLRAVLTVNGLAQIGLSIVTGPLLAVCQLAVQ